MGRPPDPICLDHTDPDPNIPDRERAPLDDRSLRVQQSSPAGGDPADQGGEPAAPGPAEAASEGPSHDLALACLVLCVLLACLVATPKLV